MDDIFDMGTMLFIIIGTIGMIFGLLFMIEGVGALIRRKIRIPKAEYYRVEGRMVVTIASKYFDTKQYKKTTHMVSGSDAIDHGLTFIILAVLIFSCSIFLLITALSF